MALITFDADGLGLLSIVSFDALVSEVHKDTSTITKHAVEEGSDITDYVRAGNTEMDIEVLISNTPLSVGLDYLIPGTHVGALEGYSLPVSLQGAMKKWLTGAQVGGGDLFPLQTNGFPRPQSPITSTPSVRQEIPNIVAGTSLQFLRRVDRVVEVYKALKTVANKGLEVHYYSKLQDYPKMYITSLSAPLMAEDAISLSISLSTVRFAKSKYVTVTKRVAETRAVKVPPAAEVPVAAPLEPLQSLADTGDGDSTSHPRAISMLIAEKALSSGLL